MGNKYNIIIGNPHAFYRTAGYKAPHDVNITLKQLGFTEVRAGADTTIKIVSLFVILFRLIRIGVRLRKDDIFVIQYPSFPLLFVVMPFFLHCDKRVLLIHDFHSLRLKGRMGVLERLNVSFFNKLIVHTQNMKEYLLKFYPKKSYYVLGCFGYILERPYDYGMRSLTNEICFAGNLDKSSFIKGLIHENGIGCKYHLYGKNTNVINSVSGNIIYEGMFHPDKVGILKGSWGLVWDGDDLSSCNGYLGEYLKLNAPHKFSLYIAVGLPVIVWSGSAMADVVRNKKIGIVVDSLYELRNKIETVSGKEYTDFVENVFILSRRLQEYTMLKALFPKMCV